MTIQGSVEQTAVPATAFAVSDLSVAFGEALVVSGVSFHTEPGKIVGIAGESGSGKTTAVLSAMGYTPDGATRLSGRAELGPTDILSCSADELRRIWSRRVSYVPQDAIGSLNPSRRVGSLLREVLIVNLGMTRMAARARAEHLLASVGIPEPRRSLDKYAHEFSGGQAQRVALALAFATEPELLVLDEPTTGLDPTTQVEVVRTLRSMIDGSSTSAIFVSHDLALLRQIAELMVIMYSGEVVESGATSEVMARPLHPYTRGLVDALPSLTGRSLPRSLPGSPPGRVIQSRCAFAARCRYAQDVCRHEHPLLVESTPGRPVRCLRQPEIGVLAPPTSVVQGEAIRSDARVGEALFDASHVTFAYGSGKATAPALSDVSIRVLARECVALVGESGSGKSTLGRIASGLLERAGGDLSWRESALPSRPRNRTREQRRSLQIVFQNPDSSLNPRHDVNRLIERAVRLFRPELSVSEREDVIHTALIEVHLDPSLATRYPHQLSGGQKQRVAIARALVAQPDLLICDEITSAQDVSVQASLLELLIGLQEMHSLALLFISHDMAVVRAIADYTYVIRHGEVVEEGETRRLFDTPTNPYTVALLNSVSQLVIPRVRGGE